MTVVPGNSNAWKPLRFERECTPLQWNVPGRTEAAILASTRTPRRGSGRMYIRLGGLDSKRAGLSVIQCESGLKGIRVRPQSHRTQGQDVPGIHEICRLARAPWKGSCRECH